MSHVFDLLFVSIAVRSALVGIFLVVGLRVMGKRELGQMNVYDLAAILLLANAVQNAMTEGKGQLGVGVASAGTLLLLGAGMSYIFIRLPKLEQRVVGVPTILIQDGKLLPDHLRRENVTLDEVTLVLREHEIERIDQVKLAVLEPDGTMSVVPLDAPEPPPAA